MKNLMLIALSVLCLTFTSCNKDDDITEEIDTSMPNGSTSTLKSGSLVDQNTKGTMGTASIIKDEDDTYFVKFSSDFETTLATGTVSLFLTQSATFKTTVDDTQEVIGFINSNGEQFFKLSAAPSDDFDHVILWCSTAAVPFGYASFATAQ